MPVPCDPCIILQSNTTLSVKLTQIKKNRDNKRQSCFYLLSKTALNGLKNLSWFSANLCISAKITCDGFN